MSAPYPVAALREAVTNAVVHGDYLRPGAEVEVKMFADRLVISNPGGLLPGVTLEALRRSPHRSERRNPLVAATLFTDYMVERYGTGTTRILDALTRIGALSRVGTRGAGVYYVLASGTVPSDTVLGAEREGT